MDFISKLAESKFFVLTFDNSSLLKLKKQLPNQLLILKIKI